MGNADSSEEGPKFGYHVLKVQEGSPADEAQLEPYFDYIIAIDGERLSEDSLEFVNTIKGFLIKVQFFHQELAHENQSLSMILYNSKYQKYREVTIVPSTGWGGDGLLGCSIRFCSYENAAENVWHILHIHAHSPAERAKLRAHTDYIIGSPNAVLREKEDFYDLLDMYVGKPLRLFVYNWETDACREVAIIPDNNWGGEGNMGCDIGFGYLHRIPNRKFTSDDASVLVQEQKHRDDTDGDENQIPALNNDRVTAVKNPLQEVFPSSSYSETDLPFSKKQVTKKAGVIIERQDNDSSVEETLTVNLVAS